MNKKRVVTLLILCSFIFEILAFPISSFANSNETKNLDENNIVIEELAKDEDKEKILDEEGDVDDQKENLNDEEKTLEITDDDKNPDMAIISVKTKPDSGNETTLLDNHQSKLPQSNLSLRDVIRSLRGENPDFDNEMKNLEKDYTIYSYNFGDQENLQLEDRIELVDKNEIIINCIEKIKLKSLNLEFGFIDILHNKNNTIEKNLKIEVPEQADYKVNIIGEKNSNKIVVKTSYKDEKDKEIEKSNNITIENYTLKEDISKEYNKATFPKEFKLEGIEIVPNKLDKVNGNLKRVIQLENKNLEKYSFYFLGLDKYMFSHKNTNIEINILRDELFKELKFINRVEEKDDLFEGFEKNSLYYNDDLEVELRNDFVNKLFEEPKLQSAREYDFDIYTEDGVKDETLLKDDFKKFKLSENKKETSGIKIDEKRVELEVIFNINGKEINTTQWITKDMELDLNIPIKGYKLINAKESLIIQASNLKFDEKNEVKLKYETDETQENGIGEPNTTEDLMKKVTIENTFKPNKSNKILRNYQGLLGSKIKFHPIENYNCKYYENEDERFVFDYENDRYQLADNREKILVMNNEKNKLEFRFVDNKYIVHKIRYIDEKTGEKIIEDQYYYETSNNSVTKIPVLSMMDKGFVLSEETLKLLGDDKTSYFVKNNGENTDVVFKFKKAEDINFEVLNLNIGFYIHSKDCPLGEGDFRDNHKELEASGCFYYSGDKDNIKGSGPISISIPIPNNLTEDEEFDIVLPIKTKIGPADLKQYKIYDDKNNFFVVEGFSNKDDIYVGGENDVSLTLKLNKSRIEQIRKNQENQDNKEKSDIDFFYKWYGGSPAEWPSLTNTITVEYFQTNKNNINENIIDEKANVVKLSTESYKVLTNMNFKLDRYKFENTDNSNMYEFINKDLKYSNKIDVNNNISDIFESKITKDEYVGWYFLYNNVDPEEVPKIIEVNLIHKYLDEDNLLESYILKDINFLIDNINLLDTDKKILSDSKNIIETTGIGKLKIRKKSLTDIINDIKKVVNNINDSELSGENREEISRIRDFDLSKIDFNSKDYTFQKKDFKGEYFDTGTYIVTSADFITSFSPMSTVIKIGGVNYRYTYEYRPIGNLNEKYYKLKDQPRNSEGQVDLPIKYIRRITNIEEIPEVVPDSKYGNYKINYIVSGIQRKDGGAIEKLTYNDTNKIKGELINNNSEYNVIFASIGSRLLNGIKFDIKPYNFEEYNYFNQGYMIEENKQYTVIIEKNKTKEVNFYYYIKENPGPIPIKKTGYEIKFKEYKNFDDKTDVARLKEEDFTEITAVPNIVKRDFFEGAKSDLEIAQNLENKGYYILRYPYEGQEKGYKNLIRYQEYINNAEIKKYFEKEIESLRLGNIDEINFYYAHLNDPLNYSVEYKDYDSKKDIADGKYKVFEKDENIKDIKDLVERNIEEPFVIENYKYLKVDYDEKNNKIIFYYTKPLAYTVDFKDKITDEKIVESKNVDKIYDEKDIEELSKDLLVKGYKLVSVKSEGEKTYDNLKSDNQEQKQLITRADLYKYFIEKGTNYNLTFYYEKMKYDITHLDIDLDKSLDGLFKEEEIKDINYNGEISRKANNIAGYYSITKPIDIKLNNFLNEDKTFKEKNPIFKYEYKRDLKYVVKYIDRDTKEEIHSRKNSSLRDRDEIKENAIDISGYNSLDPKTQTIKRESYYKIDADGKKELDKDEIVIIFEYDKIIGSKKKRPIKPKEEVKIEEKLDKKNHFEYIQGYPEGTVRPEGKITREEVSAVFYRLLTENYKGSIYSLENNYKDVENKRWSNKHISTLSKGKIVEGYEDGNFRPGQNVTRAEVAVIASRFDSLSSTKNNFSDVKGHWAEEYIGSASSKGWIKGYPDGSFRPDEYITRAEFVTLVNNVLERGVKKEHILKGIKEFTDLREDEWYYEAMVEAINGHIYERANTLEIWKELKDFNFDM